MVKKPNLKKKRFYLSRFQVLSSMLVVGVLALSGLSLVLPPVSKAGKMIILYPPPSDAHNNLQLTTFGYYEIPDAPTSAPQPGGTCAADGPHGSECTCMTYEEDAIGCQQPPDTCDNAAGDTHSNVTGKNYCIYVDNMRTSPFFSQFLHNYDKNFPTIEHQAWVDHSDFTAHPSCSHFCFGKPVIYLYPQRPTEVAVKLTIPGVITKSIPTYPVATGWEHVLAQPSGELTYQGKHYTELYYEDSVTKHEVPDTGVVIPTGQLQDKLTEYTTKLGLKPAEQQEFLAYWLPRLYALNQPYILFSVLTAEQKDAVDHVSISPKPDTEIAFLVYFKPLATPITIAPLAITPPPARSGFTEVEWGGTIDNR